MSRSNPSDSTNVSNLMNKPAHHEALPAPGQDSVHKHFEGRDSADDQPQQHGGQESEIPKDLKPASTGLIIIAGIVAVVAFIGLFILGFVPHLRREHAAKEQATAINDSRPIVQVAPPKKKDAPIDVKLPADARAFQETAIFSRATGFVIKQRVDIGDKVQAGDLLATIDQPDQEAELNQAKAALGQAQANLNRAQSDYELAQTTLKRYEGFAATGGVTQQALDEKRSAFIEAQSSLEGGRANVKAADATVQRLQTLVGFGQITAPFSGTISRRNFDVGAYISPNSGQGQELFRIADVSTLRVFVNVPQTYVNSIRIGEQKANLEVSNYPGKKFEGIVTRSAGQLDPSTRTLRYEIDFPNGGGELYAGMYGTVTMPIPPAVPPMTVPTSALVFDASGTRVWAIKEGDAVTAKVVTVGRDLGQELEILTGLKGDEKVVTNPGLRLAEGTQVQIAQPPPQQPMAANSK